MRKLYLVGVTLSVLLIGMTVAQQAKGKETRIHNKNNNYIESIILNDLKKYKNDYEHINDFNNINTVRTVKIDFNKYIEVKKVIFNPSNVTEKSNIMHNELYEILKDTNLKDVTDSLIEAEDEYGVNAIFLASLVALESGWGNSSRATRDNNMGGVSVYTSQSRGKIYNSRKDSVLHIAKFLKEDYLNQDGEYYIGLSIKDINKNYCTKKNWASQITQIGNELMEEYHGKFKR